ncbi:hypothetical protein [Streptomyces sp. H39-S7]|uniref:hypothetical protein n=1 Tax=Streptomyces sp. H39-S7 TaxID=3004357 RepID=UPI0022B03229|nr:hypothetical protein [Streptomyces sp. H39-S7]MCZ4120278.1 hypothetical protein [Streptomyces sp. H39-S7]
MPLSALSIAPDATLTDIALPQDYRAQLLLLRNLVGGTVDAAVFHRRAYLHVHGEGAILRAPMNVAAWALASQWRGAEIPYGLYGTAVVTGPGDAGFQGLDAAMAAQVKAVCTGIHDLLVQWQTQPPADEQAARAHVLATAHYQLAAAH